MSMIEKFLEDKEALRKGIEVIRDEALKVASEKADEMIDNFVNNFKEKVANVSEAEFMEFITSGKLEDEDILVAITFRAQSGVKSTEDVAEKVCACARSGIPAFIFMLGL